MPGKIPPFLLFFLLSAFLSAGTSPDIAARLVLDRAAVTVGEEVTGTLTLEGNRIGEVKIHTRAGFPETPKNAGEKKSGNGFRVPPYEITGISRKDPVITVTVRFYRTGRHDFPVLDLSLDGQTVVYPSLPLEVKPVNQDGSYQDIEEPLELSGNYYRLIIIAAAVLLAALAGFFGYRFLKKRKSRPAEPIPVAAIDEFHENLRILDPERLARDGKLGEYGFGMSHITRLYLTKVLGHEMNELTTGEIASLFEGPLKKTVPARYRDQLLKQMELWDLIKFAEFSPAIDTILLNLRETKEVAEKISRGYGNPNLS